MSNRLVGSETQVESRAQPFLKKELYKHQDPLRDGLISVPSVRRFSIRKGSTERVGLPFPGQSLSPPPGWSTGAVRAEVI